MLPQNHDVIWSATANLDNFLGASSFVDNVRTFYHSADT